MNYREITEEEFKEALAIMTTYLEQMDVSKEETNHFDVIKESVMGDAAFYAEMGIKNESYDEIMEKLRLSEKYIKSFQWFETQFKKGKFHL